VPLVNPSYLRTDNLASNLSAEATDYYNSPIIER